MDVDGQREASPSRWSRSAPSSSCISTGRTQRTALSSIITSIPTALVLLLLHVVLLQPLVLVAHAQGPSNPSGGGGNAPGSLTNFTIPLASPSIVYTPFLCNATQVIASPQICAGGWQASAAGSSPTNPSNVSVFLNGPNNATSNLIPQLFFRFQATALFLTIASPSNASGTITIDTNGTFRSAPFDSKFGGGSVTGIPANITSLFTITLTPQTQPTLLTLAEIMVTTVNDVSLSSLFPSATLPPSASLSTFPTPTPQPSSSSSSSSALPSQTAMVGSNTKKKIAEAVGITIGLGLGLTALAVLAFCFWSKRRRRRREEAMEEKRETGRGRSPRVKDGVGYMRGRESSPGEGFEGGEGAGGLGEGDAGVPRAEWSSGNGNDTPPRHRPRWPV